MPKNTAPLLVIDRKTGLLVPEAVLGDGLLRLAYSRPWATLARWLLFRPSLPSRLLGRYADSRWSARKIAPTIGQLGIDMDDFVIPETGFHTFNEFFYRRLKPGRRPFDSAPGVISSPADCRLFAKPVLATGECFPVKGVPFTVRELLGSSASAQAAAPAFHGGTLLIARLCPADYHRYHFPFSGTVQDQWVVPGGYESVNPFPLANGARPFRGNWRQVSILRHATAGDCGYVEVGAFGVGAVINTHVGTAFQKMAEKGYFAFGGSTIVLLFPPNTIKLSQDLVANSANGLETLVRAGETIGVVGA